MITDTRYLAKPNINNTTGQKVFDTLTEAVAYLEERTGHKMDFVVDRKTKVKTYDWEIIGKLKRIEAQPNRA
jgi:hypothetical protein